MLSGKDNENGEKTTIGLISKKATLQVHHTLLVKVCRCFARPQRETSRNSLVTGWRKCRTCPCYLFFFTAAQFHLSGRYHFAFSHRR